MKSILTVTLMFCFSIAYSQSINFTSEYNQINWPLSLGLKGGLTGDDGNYKRLALYHGNAIAFQLSNTPDITKTKLLVTNVGIGINVLTPTQALHVNGVIRGVGGASGAGELQLDDGTELYGFQIRKQSEYNLTPHWAIKAVQNLPVAIFTGNDPHKGIFIAANSGNVGIMTSIPDAPLTVNGQIHAEEVKVTTNIEWADYVFDKTYKLPSLDQVKTFVNQYHHLPEIPSAAEVKENGIKLAEMNALLVKKIEELTLYVIDLKDDNIELRKDVDALKAALDKK